MSEELDDLRDGRPIHIQEVPELRTLQFTSGDEHPLGMKVFLHNYRRMFVSEVSEVELLPPIRGRAFRVTLRGRWTLEDIPQGSRPFAHALESEVRTHLTRYLQEQKRLWREKSDRARAELAEANEHLHRIEGDLARSAIRF